MSVIARSVCYDALDSAVFRHLRRRLVGADEQVVSDTERLDGRLVEIDGHVDVGQVDCRQHDELFGTSDVGQNRFVCNRCLELLSTHWKN